MLMSNTHIFLYMISVWKYDAVKYFSPRTQNINGISEAKKNTTEIEYWYITLYISLQL